MFKLPISKMKNSQYVCVNESQILITIVHRRMILLPSTSKVNVLDAG